MTAKATALSLHYIFKVPTIKLLTVVLEVACTISYIKSDQAWRYKLLLSHVVW